MKRNPIPRALVRARRADEAYEGGLRAAQKVLGDLLVERGASGAPNVHMNSLRNDISRMAASPEALAVIKYGLPAAAIAAPAIEIGDNESYANQAMDLLGMGVGAYGMNYGLNRLGGTTAMIGPVTNVGAQLQRPMARAGMIGASSLGMLALSDALQTLVGGGRG